MATLLDTLSAIEQLSDDDVIYARRPWTRTSACIVLHKDASAPDGFESFLDAITLRDDVVDALPPTLTPEQLADVAIYYAEYDAYPSWDWLDELIEPHAYASARDGIVSATQEDDIARIPGALTTYAVREPSCDEAFARVLPLANHPDEWVRGTAIQCLGTIVKRHGRVTADIAAVVRAAVDDASDIVRGQARYAVEAVSGVDG